MGMLAEFRKFAMRGNVLDLAVGVIIGGAFGKIVTSLVNDLVMPIVGKLVGNTNFNHLYLWLGEGPKPSTIDEARKSGEAFIGYGSFLQTSLDFLIVAFAVFLMVKAVNRAQDLMERKAEEPNPPPEVPKDIKLLTEIRDALLARSKDSL